MTHGLCPSPNLLMHTETVEAGCINVTPYRACPAGMCMQCSMASAACTGMEDLKRCRTQHGSIRQHRAVCRQGQPVLTSAMMSVAFALPMARRRLLRMAHAFASFQSCRIVRSSQTSPSLPAGMVPGRQRPHHHLQVAECAYGGYGIGVVCQPRVQQVIDD